MKLLLARETPTGIRLVVHLDPTKLQEDGTPDPAWCLEHTWVPFRPGEKAHGGTNAPTVTKVQYVAQVRTEFKLLAQAALAKLQATATPDAGTALPGEGETL